ncbi:MAG: SpoIID/LytB domain-containing protein [Oscillospiraceae bacterium]
MQNREGGNDSMRLAVSLIALLAALTLAIPLAAASLARSAPPAEAQLSQAGSPASEPEPPPDRAGLAAAETAAWPPRPSDVAPSSPSVTGKRTFSILNRTTQRIEKVDALDYVRGALASEMPPTFHAEALAAQAVAAHTWALYHAAWQREHPDPSLRGADFSFDPPRDEGYLTEKRMRERYGATADAWIPKINAAAAYGAAHALTYEGAPILACYSSSSAGKTESSGNVWSVGLPYLVPVESEGDALAPDFEVTASFPKAEMRRLLTAAFPKAALADGDPANWLVPLERSEGGYITRISVGGREAHGQAVRTALGLRSSCFTVVYSGGSFAITTEGYGHGVGLSQYGADFMARQQSDCAEILAHYYPGTVLSSVT